MKHNGYAALDDMALLCMRGSGAKNYLQTQCTQDVKRLSPTQAIYGVILTPQGKTLADLRVVQVDEQTLYVLHDRSASDALMQRLRMFALGHDVSFELLPWSLQAGYGVIATAWLEGHDNTTPLACVTANDGALLLVQADGVADVWRIAATEWQAVDGAELLNADEQEQLRIAAGIPRFGHDWGAGDYPLNANLREMDGISFDKGCYVGQEISSRMHWRNGVRHALYHVRLATMPTSLPCDVCSSVAIGRLSSCTKLDDGSVLGIARLPANIMAEDQQASRQSLHVEDNIQLEPLAICQRVVEETA